jgi:hypothetical protein
MKRSNTTKPSPTDSFPSLYRPTSPRKPSSQAPLHRKRKRRNIPTPVQTSLLSDIEVGDRDTSQDPSRISGYEDDDEVSYAQLIDLR